MLSVPSISIAVIDIKGKFQHAFHKAIKPKHFQYSNSFERERSLKPLTRISSKLFPNIHVDVIAFICKVVEVRGKRV